MRKMCDDARRVAVQIETLDEIDLTGGRALGRRRRAADDVDRITEQGDGR
jgi:hypothetical protein